MMRRVGRTAVPAVLAVALVAACSDGDEPPAATDPGITVVDASPTGSTPTGSTVAGGTEPAPGASDVVVEASFDGESVRFEGDLAESGDPFGEFVSCSGARAAFTSYSIVAAVTAGEIRTMTVATDETVEVDGIHDATVRVEFADGETVGAAGTMALDAGFETGSFTAFTDDGALLEGSFECRGGGEPVPLDLGGDDGRLDSIDAAALLRTSTGERLVGFAAAAGDATTLMCPAVERAAESDVIVGLEADGSVGAINRFELLGGQSPSLAMTVGSTEYRFDDVTLTSTGATGTFSASAGDVSVDGAYRCT